MNLRNYYVHTFSVSRDLSIAQCDGYLTMLKLENYRLKIVCYHKFSQNKVFVLQNSTEF